jgi:hypothetical protein
MGAAPTHRRLGNFTFVLAVVHINAALPETSRTGPGKASGLIACKALQIPHAQIRRDFVGINDPIQVWGGRER